MSEHYEYILTRNQIIEAAYSKIGEVVLGQNLTAEQLDNGVRNLNAMVQDWQNSQIFLWNIESIPITTVAEQQEYPVAGDAPVLYIDKAYIHQSNQTILPLEVITLDEILRDTHPSVAEPSAIAFDMKTTKVSLFPVPDKAYTVTLICATRGKDWGEPSENNFPERYQIALIYGLAALLADDAVLPIREREALERKAEYYFLKARKNERERVDYTAIMGAY